VASKKAKIVRKGGQGDQASAGDAPSSSQLRRAADKKVQPASMLPGIAALADGSLDSIKR
jgi:hypothetical protein